MSIVAEYAIAALLLAGAAFTLLGSLGLARLPDFFMRLHGPTKATTLGVGGVVLAAVVYFSIAGDGLSLHALACIPFLFMTAPVSAQLLAKAALRRREQKQDQPSSN
jgi:multicomponent K+:H+ antiporter subunit G